MPLFIRAEVFSNMRNTWKCNCHLGSLLSSTRSNDVLYKYLCMQKSNKMEEKSCFSPVIRTPQMLKTQHSRVFHVYNIIINNVCHKKKQNLT